MNLFINGRYLWKGISLLLVAKLVARTVFYNTVTFKEFCVGCLKKTDDEWSCYCHYLASCENSFQVPSYARMWEYLSYLNTQTPSTKNFASLNSDSCKCHRRQVTIPIRSTTFYRFPPISNWHTCN